jgi:hypothetical protein
LITLNYISCAVAEVLSSRKAVTKMAKMAKMVEKHIDYFEEALMG